MRTHSQIALALTGLLVISGLGLSLAEAPVSATESSALQATESPMSEEKAAAKVVKKVAPKKRLSASLVQLNNIESNLLPIVRQAGIKLEDQVLADRMMRIVLPQQCQTIIKKFIVSYAGDMDSRGYAGASTLIIDGNVPAAEKAALLVHEVGHVLDTGCFAGSPSQGDSGFKDGSLTIYKDDPSLSFYNISWSTESIQKPGTKKADFVSGYAAANVFEDFSETLTYYVFAKEAFKERAKENKALEAKYNWIETHVFPGGKTYSQGLAWNGKIPWDATKLAYVWEGPELAAR